MDTIERVTSPDDATGLINDRKEAKREEKADD